MLVGIDFDNTIVCYDQLFHEAAVEQGLISADVPVAKGLVRDYLRRGGKEDAWTELQGYVYGVSIQRAPMFSGVMEFFALCKQKRVPVCIISHRTRYPFQGPVYDLHQAAHEWLENRGFYDPARGGISRHQVFFELSKQEKLNRIDSLGCSHFIDDLPEFLAEPEFPAEVERILFDPNHNWSEDHSFRYTTSWAEIGEIIAP